MNKHTPGPWQWDESGYTLRPSNPNPDVSNVHTIIDLEYGAWGFLGKDVDAVLAEDAANHRLIAAAPELLEAVRGFANIGEYRELREAMANCLRPHEREGFLASFEKARAAVAKATGGAA